jgi:hypothetical protein
MSHSELAIAGFYDHELETSHRAPDWGGDDLFTGPAPRRRRFERAQHPSRMRDAAHDHIEPAPPAHPEPRRPSSARTQAAAPPALRDAPAPAAAASPAPAPADDRYLEPVPAGRRTVTITGRPEGHAPRRPARTIDDRIAHRPERIASWTCGLGMLSILLAIVTSQ